MRSACTCTCFAQTAYAKLLVPMNKLDVNEQGTQTAAALPAVTENLSPMPQ